MPPAFRGFSSERHQASDVPPTKALAGARRKGYEAGRAGQPESTCPYQDKRGGRHGHVITFSRAFRNWWLIGWKEGCAARGDTEEEEPA